jgi:ankyrin repeat protein
MELRRLLLRLAVILCGAASAGVHAADEVKAGFDAPIHKAAREGRRGEVERILAATPDVRDLPAGNMASTPLHLAALNLDSGPLQALLAAGAKVNVRDNTGATPLHMAAFATRTENVKLLLKAGADPYIRNEAGRDAMSMARKARADEAAGIIAIWLLKGCKAGMDCF